MIDPHKNYSSDWQTPPAWMVWAKETLGGDGVLDPCPKEWHSEKRSGLDVTWKGRIYCNPPGSNSTATVKSWWAKGRQEMAAGRCTDLVWCFFNFEVVYSVRPSPLELYGWLVMPRRRVAFVRDGELVKSPRNRTWFWTTRRPAPTPVDCLIVPTPLICATAERGKR